MARSTFKVLFYVNGSKEKNGIVPIMGRVCVSGHPKPLATHSQNRRERHPVGLYINYNNNLENGT